MMEFLEYLVNNIMVILLVAVIISSILGTIFFIESIFLAAESKKLRQLILSDKKNKKVGNGQRVVRYLDISTEIEIMNKAKKTVFDFWKKKGL